MPLSNITLELEFSSRILDDIPKHVIPKCISESECESEGESFDQIV